MLLILALFVSHPNTDSEEVGRLNPIHNPTAEYRGGGGGVLDRRYVLDLMHDGGHM